MSARNGDEVVHFMCTKGDGSIERYWKANFSSMVADADRRIQESMIVEFRHHEGVKCAEGMLRWI